MTRTRAAWPAVLRASIVVLGAGWIGAAADAGERSAAQWLQAIEQAARTQQYRGMYVYTQGDKMRASRVVHAFEAGVVSERVQPLDGPLREVLRHGDNVECIYHDQKRVVVDEFGTAGRFPSLGSAAPDEILAHYAMALDGTERVAGVSCQVIQLKPLDDVRYGYRLCVDPVAGLMLRVRTHDATGATIEQLAFTELQLGERIDPASLRASWSTAGWTRERRAAMPVDLAQRGWTLAPPPGFSLQREVSRHLGAGVDGADRETLQAVVSDGLASVSVFIEHGVESPPPTDLARRHGPTSAFIRRVGDATVTVIGEVPPATVTAIANSVAFHDPR
jgi:sigma-E factor negative regulatory protein RseB